MQGTFEPELTQRQPSQQQQQEPKPQHAAEAGAEVAGPSAPTAQPAAAEGQSPNHVETGRLYFFYKPKVNKDTVRNMADVQRFYMILKPESRTAPARLLIVGKKRLPEAKAKSHERFFGAIGVQRLFIFDLCTALQAHLVLRMKSTCCCKACAPHAFFCIYAVLLIRDEFILIFSGNASRYVQLHCTAACCVGWTTINLTHHQSSSNADAVADTVQELTADMGDKTYETKTRGTKVQPGARSLGEAAYTIARHTHR